ncbi:MAG: ribosomal protein S18-alanine N-acetyltransferase [Clostridia bacterium]
MKTINLEQIHIIDSNYMQKINAILQIEKELNLHITSKASIISELNNNYYHYIIAKKNNIIVGYISIFYMFDTMDLISIVVKKDFQKKGLASFLLEHIFNIAKKNDVKKILLEVRVSNIAAINLYLKYGFKKIHLRKSYYDNGEDALIFQKRINLTHLK